ncbi:MAG: hypothetical protein KJ629_08080 [Candidatus Omnitrophica bacterium]|nr:hypothetical protein [Candidatus Omnitrophota bacterium]MBU1366867.1 hypothetical protein [Candidatus Omnitrophota bacterium]MBU1523544.1 hypothetical protein [Candidatus Omnitrophota bacterium]MBU1811081.1 hypothetical protein [Candidatus Omnitrophota bacterium]
MDKEKALEEFFKSLRIAFNNASIYFKEHPIFIKSVEDLMKKINTLFSFLNPLRFGITPKSLLVEEKYWEGERLYEELAEIFHRRKIKSIEIKKGIAVEELIFFLELCSLPLKDIARDGGLEVILKRESQYLGNHLFVEGLDYSQLLMSEGEEQKDIWMHLLFKSVKVGQPKEINKIVNNFEKIMGKFGVKDFLENETLRNNLQVFLAHLKDKENDKFRKCTKELLGSILKNKNVSHADDLNKLKSFFEGLDKSDLSNILHEQILNDENFDSLSVKLFSRLIDKKKHEEVAASLVEKIKKEDFSNVSFKVRKKVKDLFSHTSFIPESYQRTLSYLFDGTSPLGKFSFDHDLLYDNYSFILFSLAAAEKRGDYLKPILERVLEDWERIIKSKDLECLQRFLEVLEKQRGGALSLLYLFQEIDKRIVSLLEKRILEESCSNFDFFLSKVKTTSLSLDFYLNMIFKEGKVNQNILRLFFNFFSEDLSLFYEKLKKKSYDISFLREVIENLKILNSPIGIEVLKNIFSFSNQFMKREVLRAVKELSGYNTEFLLPILKTKNTFLKKEALMILASDEKVKKKAIEILLFISNPLGIRNKILEENIKMIVEAELKDAIACLSILRKRKFFWNRNIRRTAQKVLDKWQDLK